jgi:hypothetical protein
MMTLIAQKAVLAVHCEIFIYENDTSLFINQPLNF